VTILAVSITAVVLTVVFVVTQALYLITLVHDLSMLARKVDWVELDEEAVWAAGPCRTSCSSSCRTSSKTRQLLYARTSTSSSGDGKANR